MPAHIGRLAEAMPEGDRSRQTYALVAACVEAGIPDDEIHRLAAEHKPSVEKYGERLEAEVDRLLDKVPGPRPELSSFPSSTSYRGTPQSGSRDYEENEERYPPASGEGSNRYEGNEGNEESPPRVWPKPADAGAFLGIAGDFVRRVEPHTEADPAALLGQFLVGVGSVIGRGPHVAVGADRHGVNLSAAVVGATSRGRKGTAEGWVRALLERVDRAWGDDRVQTGLSSGEGLIHAVRDPARGEEGEGRRQDRGEADKRLLAIEPEFARVLRNASRQGNTLSAQLRQAWDSPRVMRTMTRANPLKATDGHISVIGHITVEELRAELTRTDVANGFANRFLWIASKRSKLLPRGGNLHPDDLEPLADKLRLAVDWARSRQRVTPDGGYWQLWESTYEDLTADVPGLLGAATSRAEAQVTRLALLYALLDLSDFVGRKHLEAGLAFWRYCERSAAYIFGDSTGDPIADEILAVLRRRPDGMTRWDISNHFGRNRSAADIGRALELLYGRGLATFEFETTGGRSAERWRATS